MNVKSAYILPSQQRRGNSSEAVRTKFCQESKFGTRAIGQMQQINLWLGTDCENWFNALTSLLLNEGFKRSRKDYCLFVGKEEDGKFLNG